MTGAQGYGVIFGAQTIALDPLLVFLALVRPIRQNRPLTRWFVTSRTLESRFFLKPEPAVLELLGFFLARALRLFPGIQVFACVVLSNHLHLVLLDTAGELSSFCQFFFGNVAREVNILLGRTGTVFPRRFSAEEIVDDQAFADRIKYTLLNPAAARLVNEYAEWPGLVAWQLFNSKQEFKRFNRRAFAHAQRRAEPGLEPRREDFFETEILEMAPLPDGIDAEKIEREVRDEEARLRAQKPRVLGKKAILAQRFDAQPSKTDRSWRPLCHASSAAGWLKHLERVKSFRALYAAASAAFRSGMLSVQFPPWSFRPTTYVKGALAT